MTSIASQGEKTTVLLVGGTHGNELTGVHVVDHFSRSNRAKEYGSLNIETLIANPKAVKACTRYIDKDLNRSFKLDELNDVAADNSEQRLAKEINQEYGPKGDARVDVIFDLHTSTTDMQTNLVLTKIDPFHLQLAAYLKQNIDDLVVTSEANLMSDHHFLGSIANKGALLEVGPIAQGCLEYPIFKKTENVMQACLDFVEKMNKGELNELTDTVEIMSYQSKIYFPTDERDQICACVHPDLIGKAYPKIEKDDVLFKTFDGEDIYYNGEPTHLAFINESAYYDQKIAMCLCQPIQYSLDSCQPINK